VAKKDKKEEEAGSPPWMTTMGDMTMLLLVFFVLLFSMLTMDKVKYLKLEDQLKAMSFTGEMDRRTPSKEMD
jgi:chemotaxis protein MotB